MGIKEGDIVKINRGQYKGQLGTVTEVLPYYFNYVIVRMEFYNSLDRSTTFNISKLYSQLSVRLISEVR